MTYTPKPIDTSKVDLPNDLFDLIELLAEHTHDVWAQKRIKEGWTYGPGRDDVQKKHPDLMPYSKLSETEKEYDRKTCEENLKAIILLGYKIGRES